MNQRCSNKNCSRLILFVLATALAGCAGSNKVDLVAPTMLEESVGTTNSLSQTNPDVASLLGSIQQANFLVTDGKHAHETWQFTSQLQDDGSILQLFHGQHNSRIKIQDGNFVTLFEENDFSQNAKVVYDPPIITIPADLTIQLHKPTTHRMTVYTLDGKSKRDQGICTVELDVLGMQKITTPAGVFDAMVIKENRQLKLGLVKGSVTIYNAYAPKVGLIGHRVETDLITLGFIPLKKLLELKRLK